MHDEQYIDAVNRLKSKLENWFVQYVDPKKDGFHEPVSGDGQIDRVGDGRKAFR